MHFNSKLNLLGFQSHLRLHVVNSCLKVPHVTHMKVEFFTNSLLYKNANIANFVLTVPLKMN